MVRSIMLALALALSMTVTPGTAPASSAAGGTVGGLDAVSCVTSTFCMAIGWRSGPAQQPIALRWDGSTWSAQALPSAPPEHSVFPQDISCVRSTFCMALWSYGAPASVSDPAVAMAAEWNGTTWTWLSLPGVPGSAPASSGSVSCTSTTNCMAVVRWNFAYARADGPLAERWNGTHWTVLPAPPLPAGAINGFLVGVSCATTTVCMAVGRSTGTSFQRPLTERWNGARWTMLSAPSPGKLKLASLTHISCSSATVCMAVGTLVALGVGNGSITYPPLAESWNGKRWTVQAVVTPPPSQGQWTTLLGIACSGVKTCIAVGSHGYPGGGANWALAEQWNGTKWTRMSARSPRREDTLSSIACTASNRCLAVGVSGRARQKALVERWDGTRWTIQQTP